VIPDNFLTLTPLHPRVLHRPHLVETIHFEPKGGPAQMTCTCGVSIQVEYGRELAGEFSAHRLHPDRLFPGLTVPSDGHTL
jgi:hypothetical protein